MYKHLIITTFQTKTHLYIRFSTTILKQDGKYKRWEPLENTNRRATDT